MNKGTDYAGTTVFLDSDIDLAGIDFKVIGTYTTRFDMRYFGGVFDAQGHTISNLKIKNVSSIDSPGKYYAGLFGRSRGMTIKNIVLDSTCSFKISGDVRGDVLHG